MVGVSRWVVNREVAVNVKTGSGVGLFKYRSDVTHVREDTVMGEVFGTCGWVQYRLFCYDSLYWIILCYYTVVYRSEPLSRR